MRATPLSHNEERSVLLKPLVPVGTRRLPREGGSPREHPLDPPEEQNRFFKKTQKTDTLFIEVRKKHSRSAAGAPRRGISRRISEESHMLSSRVPLSHSDN